MKKVRQVIKKKSMMNVDGMKLDLTTASMIASVYDQVNPTNKKEWTHLNYHNLQTYNESWGKQERSQLNYKKDKPINLNKV